MKRLIIGLSLLLIFGHCITELASILNNIWPDVMNKKVYWFFEDKKDLQPMELYWYIKSTTDDLLWCITFFVLTKIAYQYSFKLFIVGSIFFLYHFIDAVMFWVNYKTSYWLYWSLLATIVLSIVFLILPLEKQKAIYKSIT